MKTDEVVKPLINTENFDLASFTIETRFCVLTNFSCENEFPAYLIDDLDPLPESDLKNPVIKPTTVFRYQENSKTSDSDPRLLI